MSDGGEAAPSATTPLDRQATFSGTRAPSDRLQLDPDRLARVLEARVPGFAGPVAVAQFNGGQSNPTYRLDSPSGSYALRRKPPGPLLPSAHAIEREFRVMDALGRAGFPVPKVYVLVEDVDTIGTAFYLMDRVEGRIFWDPAMPASDPAERAAVYRAMVETIAALHRFDPAAVGLGDFGKGEGYVARQVGRWSKQYLASRAAPNADMDRLIAWLPEHLPPEAPARVVHGDFRLDNLIIAPDRPAVAAVLDWELATLGDPVADFTYHLMTWIMPRLDSGAGTGSLIGVDLAAAGIPDMAAHARAYEAATGFSVLDHLDTHLAYNLFRLAAILEGIRGRVRQGTASNAAAAAMAEAVEPLAAAAWGFALRAGA